MNTICLGFTISYEPVELIQQALSAALRAYGDACATCIIQTRTPRQTELKQLKCNKELIIIDMEPYAPTFIAVQNLCVRFLQTDCSHFVKIDADTLILQWDQEFFDIAGRQILYKKGRLQKRFSQMPLNWQQDVLTKAQQNKAQAFPQLGALRGVQGSYIMFSRKVVETIRPFFFEEDTLWNDSNWAGEEQIFGYYLRMARLLTWSRQAYPLRLDLSDDRYFTSPYEQRLPLQTFSLHPVKNKEQLLYYCSYGKRPLAQKIRAVAGMEEPTLPHVNVYIAIANETLSQLQFVCDFLIRSIPSLHAILLIDNGHPNPEIFKQIQAPITVLKQTGCHTEPTIPTFYRFQLAIQHFLQQSKADYFIKCDADTLILRSPDLYSQMSGQFLLYNNNHHKTRYPHMPKDWQKQNKRLLTKENLHSLHGGFIGLSRTVAEEIEPFFYKCTTAWNPKTVRNGGNSRETHDAPLMIGEEHSLGWWLKQAKIPVEGDVDTKQKTYVTYRAQVSDIKKPETLKVFHPVKNRATLLRALKTQPLSYVPPKQYALRVLFIHPTATRFIEQDLSKPCSRARGGSQAFLLYAKALKNLLNKKIHIDYWFKKEAPPTDQYDFAICWNEPEHLTKVKAKIKILYPHLQLTSLLRAKLETHPEAADCYLVSSDFHKHEICYNETLSKKPFKLAPLGLRKELFTTKTKKNWIIYHSVPNRGLDSALEIWNKVESQLPDYEFHIFGGMDLYENTSGYHKGQRVKSLCAQLKTDLDKRIHVHGFTPHEQLFEYLAQSKILLYPTAYPETFCLAIREAMAHGVVPLCSKCGVLDEIVNEDNGLKIQDDTYEEALVKLATNEKLFKQLSQSAKKLPILSWNQAGTILMEILYELLEEFEERFTEMKY